MIKVYDIDGNILSESYDIDGNVLGQVYSVNGLPREYFYFADDTAFAKVDTSVTAQTYMGGYVEIQPDSWDGSTPVVGDTVETTDSTAWGFPMSLSDDNKGLIKTEMLSGNGKGIMYIRFPLGFAYRGYRNIDEETGLAKNIGERWKGQNSALKSWFSNIVEAGGGLAPEYWCPPVYWLTGGAYNETNQIWAGGSYSRDTTLASIKNSDPEQYNAQIEAFTNAIVDDFEYLHQNIAPVRMFGLQNEPQYGSQPYGACKWDAQTYNDVLEVLYPKIQASEILSNYNGKDNKILLHVASSDEGSPFAGIASEFIANHSDMIWGYSHHSMRKASGEAGDGYGADWYKSSEYNIIKSGKENVFINEYEYFNTSYGTNDFRCANNMLRLINELVRGKAKVLHPVIHICKPTGQNSTSTNTSGYCLYAVNLDDGSYEVNTWAYNSWKMFNDNLPVGAVVVGDYSNNIDGVGWVALRYNNQLYLFFANNTEADTTIKLDFGKQREFTGKLYNLDNLGTSLSNVFGTSIEFSIPAYSGLCWIGC